MAEKQRPLSPALSFTTAGLGGIFGWIVVHPFNTVAVRMNLASTTSSGPKLGFVASFNNIVQKEGAASLYSGLGAGIIRQIFYATARFGLFETMRDVLAKYRETDLLSRLVVGSVSGGVAALISCPAEVSLVRMSNDKALPVEQRRNYKGVSDAALRIAREEGIRAFWRGSMPFVNRAMLVGACQVGTYDQFRASYKAAGLTDPLLNVFAASMSSGLLYSLITMPLETAKNRMAFQRPDPVTKALKYRTTVQTVTTIARTEGVLSLWAGFPPYYLRCGGHTVAMFMFVEEVRKLYYKTVDGKL